MSTSQPIHVPAGSKNPQHTVTVLGGPTALLQLAGWTLLTDPTFDPAGTEYHDGPVRLLKTTDPAIPVADLPVLDAVLVSHTQHVDNLDAAGRDVATAAGLVLTTPEGSTELGGSAVGLEPWQSTVLSAPGRPSLTVTAVPAQHGPAGTEALTGPVTGFLLHVDEKHLAAQNGQDHPGSAPEAADVPTVYVSGDTVDLDAMSELAARFRVDVALLHLGAARFDALGPVQLSLGADEAVQAARRLEAPLVVAVHAEGWVHYSQDRNAYRGAFAEAGIEGRLIWPVAGEEVPLHAPAAHPTTQRRRQG